ncbi:MAG TPA: DUF1572 family protein [Bryobacteraceae bacterium]|nr:DUF1572 family protein [Bryobacteraceae bacterium]
MIEQEFVAYSADKLEQLAGRIQDCLGKLTEEQIWTRNTDNENAVGNLVLHLAGNVRQWICHGVGGQNDVRNRDSEFAARTSSDAGERLRTTIADAIAVIRNLGPDDLTAKTTVQGFNITKALAIYHVVEHFAGHTGQIIFATKLLTGKDLGYYNYLKVSAPAATDIP